MHYKLVILKGNASNFLASDGFLICDEFLVEHISANYHKIVENLKEKASSSKHSMMKKSVDIKSKYPEIFSLLSLAKSNAKTTDERTDESANNNRLLSNYYSAIEWSLDYHIKNSVLDETLINSFRNTTFKENAQRIGRIAKSIGLKCSDSDISLFEFSSTNIRRFEINEPPEMHTVISLAILNARYDNKSELHSLISKDPYILRFITKLKILRDEQNHGGEKSKKLTYDEIESIYQATFNIVNLILPDYKQENLHTRYTDDDASQRLINTELFLIKELGGEVYWKFDSNKKELLHDIVDVPNTNQFNYICSLSKLLESLLKSLLLELFTTGEYHAISKSEIITKIEGSIGDCPASLHSVREDRLQKALSCKSATLGAYTLSIIALAEIEKEDLLYIIKIVDKILRLRKHGNDVNLLVDYKELKQMRCSVLKTIKILGGI